MMLNTKTHILKIQDFLSSTEAIWRDEIMNEYPESIKAYPKEWVDLLLNLTDDELFQIDCRRPLFKLNTTSFQHFLDEIKKLIEIKNNDSCISAHPQLENWAYMGVKEKKKHEIERICPIVKKITTDRKLEKILDIGGGVGHLSRILSHYYSIPTVSIDQNLEFQNIGKKRNEKYRKLKSAKEVTFLNMTFGKESLEHNAQIKSILDEKTFTIGLHTCGPLANNLIETTMHFKGDGLLNFGCCYHRMDPFKDFSLSKFYKENIHLKLNQYSLTLATRSHAAMSMSDFVTKKRVKFYRYALHEFLCQKFQLKNIIDVGECPVHIYWDSFSKYISMKLKELKIEHDYTESYFEDFYHDKNIQAQLQKMFVCNIIRWQIGRVLELLILYDRVLFLEENGYDVTMEQYFNETLSPRNIGILATRQGN